MTALQLRRLLTALVAAVAVWGLLALVRRPPNDRLGALAIGGVDTASVDSIVMTGPGDTTVIARDRAGGRWLTNGFAAETAAVRSLLGALAGPEPPTELVAENATSHERLAVARDSARVVRVFGGGRATLALAAGKRTPDYGGVYVRPVDADAVYALRGSLADLLTRMPDEWRDRRIAGVAPDSVASIEIRRGGRAYRLQRGPRWSLAPSGREADSAAVATLLNEYRDLRAAGFARAAQQDSFDFRRPDAAVRLLSASQRVLLSVLVDSAPEGLWLRADSGGPVYRLDAWMGSRLFPAESGFVVQGSGFRVRGSGA